MIIPQKVMKTDVLTVFLKYQGLKEFKKNTLQRGNTSLKPKVLALALSASFCQV